MSNELRKIRDEAAKKYVLHNFKAPNIEDAYRDGWTDGANLTLNQKDGQRLLLEKEISELKTRLTKKDIRVGELIVESANLREDLGSKEAEIELLKQTIKHDVDKIGGAYEEQNAKLSGEIVSLRKMAESYRAKLLEIQAEIDRGKSKDCLGCCNGNDIPDEELCRACWRIWIGKKCYFLWDWEATEKRVHAALSSEEK